MKSVWPTWVRYFFPLDVQGGLKMDWWSRHASLYLRRNATMLALLAAMHALLLLTVRGWWPKWAAVLLFDVGMAVMLPFGVMVLASALLVVGRRLGR